MSFLAGSVLGCSLPTSVTTTGDAGPGAPDTGGGGMDAGPPIDAWSNVDMGARPDAWAEDMYVPGVDAYVPPVDAYVGPDMYVAPVDAFVAPDMFVPPVDAYVGADAWSAPSCDSLYGTANQYQLCAQDPSTCTFVVYLTGSVRTCNAVCGAGAGGCTHEYRNGDVAGACTVGTDDGCTNSQNNHYRICVCNRY